MLTLDTIRDAPKALLHDHLDGGLRPATVVDLAARVRLRRPADRATSTSSPRGSGAAPTASRLELYLETFAHTVGVMQDRDAIVRVAAECAEDLAADGVVYAEVRYAPELSHRAGPDARRGRRGEPRGLPDRDGARGARPATRSSSKLLVTAMRQAARSVEVAECAVRWRDAGRRRASTSPAPRPATGRPATSTRSSTSAARTSTSRSTPASRSGCRRSGRRSSSAARSGSATASGSSTTSRSATTARSQLGRLAAFVRDRRVPLEMCPTSNVHTGAAASIAEHPIDLLRRLRFRVTVNTDNRLMSGVSLSSEFEALDEAFGIGLGEMEWLTINALKSRVRPVRRAAAPDQRGREAGLRAAPAPGVLTPRYSTGAKISVRQVAGSGSAPGSLQ